MKFRGKKFQKIILGLLVGILILSTYPISTKTTFAEEYTTISRVYGETRIQTAIEIAEKGWSDNVKTVLISRKDEFADALVSTPYAYKINAPILLTSKHVLDLETKKKLKDWKPDKVIILGGNNAVSGDVEDELKNLGLSVERIGGENRYDTAALIASKLDKSNIGIVAYGENFPDALSIAPYAARNGFPILLTKKDEIPPVTAESLKNMNKTIIVGETDVISKGIEDNVNNPLRIGGVDRFDTSAKIHMQLGDSSEKAYIASGMNFPDALTGSILAAKENQSILLVKPDKLPEQIKKTVQTNVINNFTILGGEKAVSSNVENALVSTVNNLVPVSPKINGNWVYDKNTNNLTWNITWDKVKNATEYQIFRKKPEEKYEIYKTVENESFSEVISDESTYNYRVKAINRNLSSKFSNEVALDLKNDTDNDGLVDIMEVKIGTDYQLEDTDSDDLLDGFEVMNSNTDPLIADTDQNGIIDSKEDLDSDSLTNVVEQEIGTDSQKIDTDLDKISDGQEIKLGTDPLNSDTDNDNLFDGDEDPLGFNPLKKDTNNNGINDGDEVIPFKTTVDKTNANNTVTPSATIETKASDGTSTSIVNLEGDALLTNEIPGYIAPAFEFNTNVQFDEAKLEFMYDKSIVTESFSPEIFYYNEAEQRLERVEEQAHNPNSSSVTATVSHFSKYILLNGAEWDKVWEKQIVPPPTDKDGNLKDMDIVFSIDSSGSMDWMDPNDLRKEATKQFVDALTENDRSAIVDFDDDGKVLVSLTNDKEQIKVAIDSIDSSGGTDLYEGIITAIDEIVENSSDEKVKYVIFLTDGDGYWNDYAIEYAKENNVIIHTIGLGEGVNQTLLENIAASTGGKYFFSSDANELIGAIGETADEALKYKIDNDLDANGEKVGDGLPDYLETEGIINGRGIIVTTNPTDQDTDDDGLLDGEEFTITFNENLDGNIYFRENSDPTMKDSDEDGLSDSKDKNPRVFDVTPRHSLMFSELSYINMESYINDFPTIPELIIEEDFKDELEQQFDHKFSNPKTELGKWRLIAAEDSHPAPLSGFGAFAVQNGNKIIITYRGTDGKPKLGENCNSIAPLLTCIPGSNLNDWANNLGIFAFNNNMHASDAKKFAADIIMNYANDETEIYLVGHSLGGFLAQVVGYHLDQNKLDNVYAFWNKKDKEKMKSLLANENAYQVTRTFNSAPFFLPSSPYTWIGNAVPYREVVNSVKYEDRFYNYVIDGDVLHSLSNYFIGNAWVGGIRESNIFPYKNVASDEHSLPNFYDYLDKMK